MQPIKIAFIIIISILFSKTEKFWDLGVSIDSSLTSKKQQSIYGYKVPSLSKARILNKKKKNDKPSFIYSDYTENQIQQFFLKEEYDLLIHHFANKIKKTKLSENEIFYYLNTLLQIKKISSDNVLIEDLSNNKPSNIYLKILIFDSLKDQTNKTKYYNLLIEKYPTSDYALILKKFEHLINFKM